MPMKMSIGDARKNFAGMINQVTEEGEPVILTSKGKRVAALISMADFELLQQIEDRMDIKDANKALGESGGNITIQDAWQELGI